MSWVILHPVKLTAGINHPKVRGSVYALPCPLPWDPEPLFLPWVTVRVLFPKDAQCLIKVTLLVV